MKKRTSLNSELITRHHENWWSNYLYMLPDPDPILRAAGVGIDTVRQLASDSHVYSAMQQRIAGTASMKWQIGKNSADDEQASFIESILNSIEIDKLIPQILDSVFLGYSVLEIVWDYIDSYIVPITIEEKPQEWFYFDDKNILRCRDDQSSEGRPLPPNKFLVVRHQATYANPYGEKVLSRCYWPVQFKHNGLQFWVTFIEKYGMPFLAAKRPRSYSADEAKELLDSLEKMMQDTFGVLPDDSSVEFVQSSQSATSEVFSKFLAFCNTEISKAILSQTLTTEVQERGTYAAARTHQNILQHILLGDKRLVEKTINELIHMIWELNFPLPENGSLPEFELYSEEDTNKSLAERDRLLRKQGVLFTKEYYKRYYNLKDDEFEMRQ